MFATIVWFLLKAILILACVFLIVMVLLQQAKGGGLVGALGGLGGESALGTKAGTTAQKITVGLAILFLGMTIFIGKCAPRAETSVVEDTTASDTHTQSNANQPVDRSAGGVGVKKTASQEKPGASSGKDDDKAKDKKPSPPRGGGEKKKTE